MIHLNCTRFGDITIDESAEIRFPNGLVGFASETRFAIIERSQGPIAYLQSLTTPRLALPVIDASVMRPRYPSMSQEQLAAIAGVDADNMAVLIVVAINPIDKGLRANLLAPIIIDVESRTAHQIILEGTSYTANTPIGERPTIQAPTKTNTNQESPNVAAER